MTDQATCDIREINRAADLAEDGEERGDSREERLARMAELLWEMEREHYED